MTGPAWGAVRRRRLLRAPSGATSLLPHLLPRLLPRLVLTSVLVALAVLLESATLVMIAVVLLVAVAASSWARQRPTREAPPEVGPPTPRDDADRVLIVTASIGAGHDGAATELAREAREAGYVVDRVDFLDLLPWRTGTLLRAVYRWQITVAPASWGWLLTLLQRGSGTGWAAALPARLARRRLLDQVHPSTRLAVSTYPLASHSLSLLRLEGSLQVPAATYLTDMSVHPLWVAPGIDVHVALHPVPAGEARTHGARGIEVLGPKVSPRFVPVTAQARCTARRVLELPTGLPLALVVAGSWGVGEVARTVDELLATELVTPVVVCGSNAGLRCELAARTDVVVFGWVDDMASVMQACDVVIQNAGGLTSLEARQSGLPVLTYRALPGHGETNARSMAAAGWASWAQDPEELPRLLLEALGGVCAPEHPAAFPWARLAGAAAAVRA